MAQPPKRPQIGRRQKPRTPQATTTPLQDEARYREFFENANDALALFNPDGTIALVNRAAEHLLGYTRAELINQHYRKVVTPNDGRRSSGAVAQSAGEGTACVDL